jgi:uracil phosphoribosyltransferase
VKQSKNLTVLDHPVLKHKLRILRDQDTTSSEFRQVLSEISVMMAYEATRNLKLKSVEITTPLETTKAFKISTNVCVTSILRAGQGMVDGFIQTLPFASVGIIGIARNKKTNKTEQYYLKLPENIKGAHVMLVDPMLATGDTAFAAIERLKEHKVGSICFVNILASQTGVKKIHSKHPDVEILTLSVERELNSHGYLLPGLGDAGDRIFGTV